MKICQWTISTVVTFVVFSALNVPADAQKRAPDASMADPYLLIIRDPHVHDGLGVNESQREAIRRLTDNLDGRFISLRNQPVENGVPKLKELIRAARLQMSNILTPEQSTRLNQIVLRAQGIRSLLRDDVLNKLSITEKQKQQLLEISDKTDEALDQFRKRAGRETTTQSVKTESVRLRTDEQKAMLAVLTDDQKRTFVAMLGDSFDTSKLGRIAFKAPGFPGSNVWINSSATIIDDLKGKVVAVHFWAFG